jgi:uncharacterized protein (TIGR02217 family)
MGCPPFLPVRWFIGAPDVMGAPNVFPYLIGQRFLVQKSPIWKTQVASAASGRERRASFWSAPRWLFKTQYDLLRAGSSLNELAAVIAFFNTQLAQFNHWLYWDHTDNQVTNQPLGIGDGVTTAFQLQRYINGKPSAAEPIYAANGTPTIYVNGVSKPYALGNYGVVTLGTAPPVGATVSWSGFFFFLCRFDADQIDPTQDYAQIWSLKDLSWRSIKPNRAIN